MIIAAATLCLFGLVALMLAKIIRDDGGKIIAALRGQSWSSEPPCTVRPLTVRFSPRYPVIRPVRVMPELRAAA